MQHQATQNTGDAVGREGHDPATYGLKGRTIIPSIRRVLPRTYGRLATGHRPHVTQPSEVCGFADDLFDALRRVTS